MRNCLLLILIFIGQPFHINLAQAVEADLVVQVSDGNTPLSGAKVLVGTKEGAPFAENLSTTNSDGQATFSHQVLRSREVLPVTISLPGYTTLSIFRNATTTMRVTLQKLPDENDYSFLEGKVLGFPPGYNSSTLELGIFMPAFRSEALLSFDPSQIISSYKTEVDIYGKREIPGNVVFPKQDKYYSVFPIHLNKPDFIMPLQKGLHTHMAASVGAVGVSDAVNAARSKDFLGLINLVSFTHVGWTPRMTVTNNEKFNVTANQALTPQAFQAQFIGVPKDLDVISVSMVDPEGDRGDFIPLGIKAVKKEEIRSGIGRTKLSLLKRASDRDRYYAFAALVDRQQIVAAGFNGSEFMNTAGNSRAIVGSILPVSPGDQTVAFEGFFQMIRSEGADVNNRDFRFTSPANPQASLMPDLFILNVVSSKKNDHTKGQVKKVLWTALLPGSNPGRVQLPDLGAPLLPRPSAGEQFFWEITALKVEGGLGENPDVQEAIKNVKHVSSLVQKF